MSEIGEKTSNIENIGIPEIEKLLSVLVEREEQRCNAVAWGGTVADLRKGLVDNTLCPASAFAVVAEGLPRVKRPQNSVTNDTPESLREFGTTMSAGANVYSEAEMVDEKIIKAQIREYVESHGGKFDDSVNWKEFIGYISTRLLVKAKALEDFDNG